MRLIWAAVNWELQEYKKQDKGEASKNSQQRQTSKKSSLKKLREPSITTEDLQRSGNQRRNELLFKAADPVSPDELQVREVVFQACLPAREWGKNRKEKDHRNSLNPNKGSLRDEVG